MGLHFKIAYTAIKKNGRLYKPYFLTCITIIAMFYILAFVSHDNTIENMRAGAQLKYITYLGVFVIGLFSLLFLVYTNSFLTKRRKKEFGLYIVLGMSKKNIAIVLFWEMLIIALVSIVLGMLVGILFSKVSELLLIKILSEKVNFDFSIKSDALYLTPIVFVPIFTYLFIRNCISINSKNAINLVKSEEEGEKAPKTNWLLGLIGLLLLALAYFLAITCKYSFNAILIFFLAVILVIVATYLIFISSSVLLCKILQNNKKYYYKLKHFVSISTMTFRMKRNGAGLATICILSTMVLVMLSSSSSLYYGLNDTIESRYSRDINIQFKYYDPVYLDIVEKNNVDKTVNTLIEETKIEVKNKCELEVLMGNADIFLD